MSYDKERAILTKLIEGGDIGLVVRGRITEKHFTQDENKNVYRFLVGSYEQFGTVPSLALVREEFPDFNAEPTKDAAELIINTVKNRKLYEDMTKSLSTMAATVRSDPAGALKQLQTDAAVLSLENSSSEEENATEAYHQVKAAYERSKKLKGLLGYAWPWERLNAATRGIRKGQFVGLYGPGGTMKTWLLTYIAHYMHYTFEKRPIFFTYEMPVEDIRYRWAALRAGINYERFQDGRLTHDEEAKLYRTLDELAEEEVPFIITELESSGQAALTEIRAKAQQHRADVIFIDGLSFLVDTVGEWSSFAEITRGLKTLARRTRIPIIATHHANRQRGKVKAEDNETSDVAFGDALSRDVDVLLRIVRTPQHEEADELMLAIKKVREGKRCNFIINAKPAENFTQKFGDVVDALPQVSEDEEDGLLA